MIRKDQVREQSVKLGLKQGLAGICLVALALTAAGCRKKQADAAAGQAQGGFPVQTSAVTIAPVPQESEYVATIKSRRSTTIQPQVTGPLTSIRVKSGDHVRAGQVLMEIDQRLQRATVESQRATERQKKAVLDYQAIEIERQRKLFEAGVTSRDSYDSVKQSYENSKADWEASSATRRTQEEQLAYYTLRAPYDGVVGDVPVHVGDYVSPTTNLTTIDENKDLEAYVYVPTDRAGKLKTGLKVQVLDTTGKLLEESKIDFVSPQVDSTLQGVLAKAPVHSTSEILRNAQLVKVRVVWSTEPTPVIPVLAVSRQGGQAFVFIAEKQGEGKGIARQVPVTLAEAVGNSYPVISGVKQGDLIIISGTQFLVKDMPVILMPAGAPGQH